MRPHYLIRQKSQRPRFFPAQSHAGLWHDKYYGAWEALSNRRWVVDETKRRDWLNHFVSKPLGDAEILSEFAQRQTRILASRAAEPLFMQTASRFLPGQGGIHPMLGGMIFHPTLGLPYLPGSNLKGLVRTWATQWQNASPDDVARIFGAPEKPGNVIFLDALPIKPVIFELDVVTPHHVPYQHGSRPPADWDKPQSTTFLAVAKNNIFQFGIMSRINNDPIAQADALQARAWLIEALEWLGAGARTAVGYGRFTQI